MKLAVEVYKISDKLPHQEKYILISQINKCAVSIPSNIAEGCGRNSSKEYIYFLSIAQGSAFELETQLIICQELNYANREDLESVFSTLLEIQKMLFSLQDKIKRTAITKYSTKILSYLVICVLFYMLST
jgi:four helix bundle protein